MPTRKRGGGSSSGATLAGMRASSKLPAEERPIHYSASGLRAAREAAGMTIEEVAELCGYSPGVVAQVEAGTPYHSVTISRVSSVIPGHCSQHLHRVLHLPQSPTL